MLKMYFPKFEERFLVLGNVVNHPQFKHLNRLPAEVELVTNPKRIDYLKHPFRVIRELANFSLFFYQLCFSQSVSRDYLKMACRLVKWRSPKRLFEVRPRTDIEFLPTFPLTINNKPWFVEIEDSTTLFYPYLLNGKTANENILTKEWLQVVKAFLKNSNCRGIVTHVKSTLEGLKILFADEPLILAKLYYLPVAYTEKLPEVAKRDDGELICFFNNSWHQFESNFYLRGGLYVLEAFKRILGDPKRKIRLILRSRIPSELRERFATLLRDSRVEVMDTFLSDAEYRGLLAKSHVYLLPSARMHVASLLEAQAFGLAIVTSDGWGIEEVVRNATLGVIVPGIYGKVSWIDEKSGILKENYEPMFKPNESIETSLVDAIQRIESSPAWREQLGNLGRQNVVENHSLVQMNTSFESILKSMMIAQ